jgi:orotate phosphoribosyltransferase
VNHLLTVIDRQSGAREALQAFDIELVSLFDMGPLLRFYLDRAEILEEPAMRSLEHAWQLKNNFHPGPSR